MSVWVLWRQQETLQKECELLPQGRYIQLHLFSHRLQQKDFVEELVEGVGTETTRSVYGRSEEGHNICDYLGEVQADAEYIVIVVSPYR